ncbi:MAG: hypothetical protein GXX88_17250, partial [Candidatus Hydrogenedentes bacterium]|nr:hypothetical protein [Candidatus Hydrogenedentota bacterium]
MKRTSWILMVLVAGLGLSLAGSSAGAGEAVFEDVHAVPLPLQNYGYRGMPGTIIALNDGRLLLAYTRYTPDGNSDGAIGAR